MPKTIQQIRCKKCGDEFEAVSDKFTQCKCGLNSVKPSEYSTEYKTDNGMGMNFERISYKTYYYESDFYIMKGEILNLFNEVKSICEELDFHLWEDYENGENGEKYLNAVNFSYGESIGKYTNEGNNIEFVVYFKRINEEILLGRLNEFRNVLIGIKSGEIKLSDRKYMKENYDWERTNLYLYDYTFKF